MSWTWSRPVTPAPWDARTPIAARMVSRYDPASDDPSPGRRLRVFAALVAKAEGGLGMATEIGCEPWLLAADAPTYGEVLAALEAGELPGAEKLFNALPLRCAVDGPLLTEMPPDGRPANKDPELHIALQDLGNEINEDMHEAFQALDDPKFYYPGVDEGIEPVTDEHVELVIWAMQRELDRERRSATGFGQPLLPPAPLRELPWNVQRAIAERRRLRYRQWGLGREQWLSGAWSLWDVPSDPDYLPRRAVRLNAIAQRAA
jgi:hypothetical protein